MISQIVTYALLNNNIKMLLDHVVMLTRVLSNKKQVLQGKTTKCVNDKKI